MSFTYSSISQTQVFGPAEDLACEKEEHYDLSWACSINSGGNLGNFTTPSEVGQASCRLYMNKPQRFFFGVSLLIHRTPILLIFTVQLNDPSIIS